MIRHKRNKITALALFIFCSSNLHSVPEDAGIVSTMFGDIQALGSGIITGIGAAAGGVKDAWGSMPAQWRGRCKYFTLISGAALSYAYYSYHTILEPLVKEYTSDYQRLSTWSYSKFPDAHAMYANEYLFVTNFCTDLVLAARQNTLFIVDGDGIQIINPTWQHIFDAIAREKKELLHHKKILEDNFLVYFTFLDNYCSPLLGGSQGIKKDYALICKAYDATFDAPEAWMKDKEKFQAIDKAMQAACTNKWWHNMVKINYGIAARLWWKLFNLEQRLLMLEQPVKNFLAGRANEPVKEYAPVQEVTVNLNV